MNGTVNNQEEIKKNQTKTTTKTTNLQKTI